MPLFAEGNFAEGFRGEDGAGLLIRMSQVRGALPA
jgi:hypothetical protein